MYTLEIGKLYKIKIRSNMQKKPTSKLIKSYVDFCFAEHGEWICSYFCSENGYIIRNYNVDVPFDLEDKVLLSTELKNSDGWCSFLYNDKLLSVQIGRYPFNKIFEPYEPNSSLQTTIYELE